MTSPYPHLIRESFVIDHARYTTLGKEGVARLMEETEAKARAVAKQVGIERVKVRAKRWDLYVISHFTDYPMYLCGPGAPRIETPEDVFNHGCPAQYEVVLEDRDYLDTL